MAQFSDTTNLNGLIQKFEFYTNLGSGSVTGNLLKIATDRINVAFEKIMPYLLSYSDHIRWDDINHADRPIGTINLTSGQADYTITTDDNSLDILNLVAVRIIPTSSGSDYSTVLERLTMDDSRVLDAMSPDSTVSGVPSHYVENGNNLFLYPEPNYTTANGIKLYFQREHSYFVSTDTTKEPGIPKVFHELLVMHAALDWLAVNRPENGNLINKLLNDISKMESDLESLINLRNPVDVTISTAKVNFR